MRTKVLNFYKEKGFDLLKLARRKPPGINEAQVYAAADELYKQIQHGLEIKNINIPRRIYELAKNVSYKEFEQEQQILRHDQEIIAYLKDQRLALLIIIGLILATCAVIGGGLL